MCNRFELLMSRLLPGVKEDKHIVSTDAKNDENSKDVKHAEVPIVQNEPVDEEGGGEPCENAE